MKTIDVKIQGLKAFFNNIHLKPFFESKTTKFARKYGGPNHGKMMWQDVIEKMYKSVPRKGFWAGYGGIEWLNNHSEEVKFNITEITPSRGPITQELMIPEILSSSPKFKVKGKERFYFFEALEACFKTPQGTIKLPTGSGKTEIQLTLAHNQSKYIGTGMILVPTLIIKDQFIERAAKYGIKILDYSEYNPLCEKGTIFVTTHHIICERLKDKTKKKAVLDELSSVDWIIVDECAHATCSSWFDILMNLDNCQRCHGFSALPVAFETEKGKTFHDLNSDDARTIGILGSVLYEKTAHELRDFLNLPELINIKYEWPTSHRNFKNDKNWDEIRFAREWHTIRKAIILNEDRTKFIAKIMKHLVTNGYKTATFVNQKDHAEQILKYADDPSIACWFGGGVAFTKDGTVEQDYIKNSFGSDLLGLILTSHGIEGLDFNSPLNVLVLHEGKSVRQTVQKAGRIVRPDDKASIVLNICDRGCTILSKHANIRAGDIINEFMADPVNCSTFTQFVEELQIIEERQNGN